MIRRALLALAALGIGTGAWLALGSVEPPPIQDRPLILPATAHGSPGNESLHLTVLGTSLTANYDWPERLADSLDACLSGEIALTRIARPGANASWGVAQIATVLESDPDVVVIEFATNDADLRDGLSLADSWTAHRRIVEGLRAERPHLGIVLMTMNPVQGMRGWMRPRLTRYYASYPKLGAALGTGVADLFPRWLALPVEGRGLAADGLHPTADVAAAVILPVLVPMFAEGLRTTCLS